METNSFDFMFNTMHFTPNIHLKALAYSMRIKSKTRPLEFHSEGTLREVYLTPLPAAISLASNSLGLCLSFLEEKNLPKEDFNPFFLPPEPVEPGEEPGWCG